MVPYSADRIKFGIEFFFESLEYFPQCYISSEMLTFYSFFHIFNSPQNKFSFQETNYKSCRQDREVYRHWIVFKRKISCGIIY
jgi:hypothetical protein